MSADLHVLDINVAKPPPSYWPADIFLIQAVNQIVKAHKGKDITEVYMNNLFLFLEQFSLPEVGGSKPLIQKLLLYPDSGGSLSESISCYFLTD